MVEFLFKLIRNVDADKVEILHERLIITFSLLNHRKTSYLVIVHLQDLLLIGGLSLGFAMIKR
jgi:hypothetical protein